MSESLGPAHGEEDGSVEEHSRHQGPTGSVVVGMAVLLTVDLLVIRWVFSTQTTCTVDDPIHGGVCLPPGALSTMIGNWTAGVGITTVWLLAVLIIAVVLIHRRKPSTAREEGALR